MTKILLAAAAAGLAAAAIAANLPDIKRYMKIRSM
ncbi:DUF6893 family small protein [Actinacidiphila guanduensis]|jgi:hypothetical protein|uniref:Uncharacterized protein n=1 Tax=Actinacidiphila guanduensis TaxID=310781 RepID=A0A1H0HJW7_9ACTN|nr:hypothetical protein SAMN05216259_10888 [Actinacidiphila guanduensis]